MKRCKYEVRDIIVGKSLRGIKNKVIKAYDDIHTMARLKDMKITRITIGYQYVEDDTK